MRIIILFCFLFETFFSITFAQESLPKEEIKNSAENSNNISENGNGTQEKEQDSIGLWDLFKKLPATASETLSTGFSKEALPAWGVIIGSTALLYAFDEQILSGVTHLGEDLGITGENNYHVIVRVSDLKILQIPKNRSALLYYMGDGWVHAGFAGGMYVYGKSVGSTRAMNTGMIILHGMMITAVFDQVLKRSFGRESPYVKTQDRGAWHPFVSPSKYSKDTPKYDAMPSGHIMTATLTFTVLAEQYPEYQRPIYYVGGAYLTILGLQMINIGVHWASDYPLGIAMGYLIGKSAVKVFNKNASETASYKQNSNNPLDWDWKLFPFAYGDNLSVNLVAEF